MAYLINKSDGTALLTLEDGILDTSTSLGLLGRNYIGYGEVQNENFVYLLENFANANPPARPIRGQAWYDSSTNRLNVYSGEQWVPVGAATISDTPPPEFLGSLWIKTPNNQLFVFLANGWELIGPEAAPGFEKTRAEATILKDIAGVDHAVVIFRVNGIAEGIVATEPFSISPSTPVTGFFNLLKGINVNSSSTFQGKLTGNADTSTRLETPRKINNVPFDGTSDITITANTPGLLTSGDYILGGDFNGSSTIRWDIDASSANSIGSIVARDSAGDFEANNITAVSFTGTLLGNVNVSTGTSAFNNINVNDINGRYFSGIAATAQKLTPGRTINGVFFDGLSDITVTAEAGTLTGNSLNSTISESNLSKLGTLVDLTVLDAGITIGTGNTLKLSVESNVPTVTSTGSFDIVVENLGPDISFVTSSEAVAVGSPYAPAILSNNSVNIGGPNRKFDKVYANSFVGNASTATALQTQRTINGVPFDGTQNIVVLDNTKLPTAGGTITGSLVVDGNFTVPTSKVIVGTTNRFEIGVTSTVPTINSSVSFNIGVGSDGPQLSFVTSADAALAGGPSSPAILSNNNINIGGPSRKFDKVYANLFVGNANSATVLETARKINNVSFNGSQDITITDDTKLPTVGGTITGNLAVNGYVVATQAPVFDSHLANKFYVDNKRYVVKIHYAGNTNNSFTANWNNGEIQYVTANANFVLNVPANMPSGTSLTLIISQDASGSKTMTPATGYIFASGYKTLSSAANSVDMLSIFRAESTYYVTLTTGYVA